MDIYRNMDLMRQANQTDNIFPKAESKAVENGSCLNYEYASSSQDIYPDYNYNKIVHFVRLVMTKNKMDWM